jgi:processive 1,2-diacylglycerol beta-glucosyltransferase
VRILITSVPAGSGHVRAAEALLAAFRTTAPDVNAEHVQVTDLVTPGFRKIYVDGYRVTVDHIPSLWGRVYRFWDNRPSDGSLAPLLYRAQRLCANGFYEYLDRSRPDLIISTHFLIPQLLSAHPDLSFRPVVESVITDYDVHRFWVSDVVSRYYVAHDDMAALLVRHAVPLSRITVSGIPVHPAFSEPVLCSSVFRNLQLEPQHPVILMLSGGLGLAQLKAAVRQLFSLPEGTQIVTVAGRNESLRRELNELRPPPSIRLLNLGYVTNMHELLTISDLVITKPGGLTVSECLAKRKAMVLFSPIPGQEEKNTEFLLRHEAAVQVKVLDELPEIVMRLLSDRSLRGRQLWKAESCARPRAAFTIAETAARSFSLVA